MLDVISSWSTGKDSCLACYKAIEQGYNVKYLLNFISKEHKRCCFHGLENRLVCAQSNVMETPIVQKEVSPDMKDYEKEFKDAVSKLKNKGVKGMVFGDVYLDEHKEWIERVCDELKIKPIQPLWNIPAEDVVQEFINLGFKAIVVSCKADLLGKEFIGKYVNNKLIDRLKEKKICPCGENGEYHTFVINGPLFKKRIEITNSKSVLKQGFWKYWFLDIKDWHIEEKTLIKEA